VVRIPNSGRQLPAALPPAPAPGPATGGAPENRRPAVYVFIAAVMLVAVLVGFHHRTAITDPGAFRTLLAWLVATVLAEIFWLPTITGRATSSMASSVNFAALFILGPPGATWVAAIAAGLASLAIQRRSVLRALYNLSQTAITMAVAGFLDLALGGGPVTVEDFRDPTSLIHFFAVGLGYIVVNTGLVATVVALWEGQPVFKVWRENYGFADDLLTSLALFLLSPLIVLSLLTLGPVGITLFFVPMLLIRNSAVRYVELRAAQDQLVWNERMAAMGEMAGEIGHELGNALQVIGSRSQLLLAEAETLKNERMATAIRVIFERVSDMRRLTTGLMDFSHRDVKPRRERLNRLVQEAVDFVSPQNRFDGVKWVVALDPSDPEVDLDAGQFRQVLLNLFGNAAEAMAEAGVKGPSIEVRTKVAGTSIELKVRDNGTGVPPAIQSRIFEPRFTTKAKGHGFGLAVTYRIIKNHGGTIAVKNASGGGAEFRMTLPARPAATAGGESGSRPESGPGAGSGQRAA
jgi:signal transduction histidine kinase